METNYIQIPYPDFSITEFIDKKAQSFSRSFMDVTCLDTSSQGLQRVDNELEKLNSEKDKIQFVSYCINKIITGISKHKEKCTGCSAENESIEMLYYLYGKLNHYGLHTNVEDFSQEEIHKNYDVINTIIYKLEEIKAGNDLLSQDIETINNAKEDLEEIKYLTPLGKKLFNLGIKGFMAQYIATKLLDGIVALAITPYLLALINNPPLIK